MAKKKSSSKAWLKEHHDDLFVQQAKRDGYRSRACYKLLELQDKDHLMKPGMTVVDLGSAPGGWSQVSADLVGHKGRVVASDILHMDNLADVEFIQGDFTEDEVFERILHAIDGEPVDLVVSDSEGAAKCNASSLVLVSHSLVGHQEHPRQNSNNIPIP